MSIAVFEREEATPSLFDGKYEIVGTLGQGRKSIVYKALPVSSVEDAGGEPTSSAVALKVISRNAKHSQENTARLANEARAMLASRNAHVIRLFDFVASEDANYLVLELAEFGDLGQLLNQPLPLAAALNYTKQLLTGLSAVHRAGIVHCDIKPENLLITAGNILKISDFGIAHLPNVRNRLEDLSRGVGTLPYLAPETLSGRGYSFSSDLYAVGVTLFQLLTLRLPFEGRTLPEQIEKKMSGNRPKLDSLITSDNSGLPSAKTTELLNQIEKILDRALAVKPNSRFESADNFLVEIERVLESLTANTETTFAECISEGNNQVSRIRHSGRALLNRARLPIKYAALAALSVILLLVVSIKAGGVGFAMVRTGLAKAHTQLHLGSSSPKIIELPPADTTLIHTVVSDDSALLDSKSQNNFGKDGEVAQVHYGVLYDFWGHQKDVSIVATQTGSKTESLLALSIPGWSPTTADITALDGGGQLKLQSGGMQVLLASSAANKIPGSFASGEYKDFGSKRTGRWVLW